MSLKNSYIDFEVGDHIHVATFLRSFKMILKKYSTKLGCLQNLHFNKWGQSVITDSDLQLSNHTSCDQSCFSKKPGNRTLCTLCVFVCVCVLKQVKQVPFIVKKKKKSQDSEQKLGGKKPQGSSDPSTPLKATPATAAKQSMTVIICAYISVDNLLLTRGGACAICL